MKKILTILFFITLCIQIQGKCSAICDVIYEINSGEWSDYQRVKVDFMTGRELGYAYEQYKIYAIIRQYASSDIVIKLDYQNYSTSEVDQFFLELLLISDILNEGRAGVQTVNGKQIKWRIYGKDDNSFLIDSRFGNDYNNEVRRDQRNGIITKRQRPKEESRYTGLVKGVVEYVSSNEWYIVRTKDYYVGVKRNTRYHFYGSINVGDIVYADFHNKGETAISNYTKNTTHHYVIVKYLCHNYDECYNWMNQQDY